MKIIRIVIIAISALTSQQNHAFALVNDFASAVTDHPYIATACVAGTFATAYAVDAHINHTPLHWNWNKININNINFPENFLWGSATSAPQIEGGSIHSNWTMWEKLQKSNPNFSPAGRACDHWNRVEEDARLAREAGLNALGISLSWDKIEPREGEFNEEAIQHYIDECKILNSYGVRPIVCFHFYTHPQWFEEKGAFENEENIAYFVRFCELMFDRLHEHVYQWLTFTNPTSYAIKGYKEGMMTPGVRNMQRMQVVLKNMLEAHTQVYHACKKRPGGKESQIGIKHTQFLVESWNPYNPLDRLASGMAFKLFSENVYTYFRTGTFKVYIPCYVNVNHHNPLGARSLDFIVCCYYSHGYIKNFKAVRSPDEMAIDNHPLYSVYPEGVYRAIQEMHKYVAGPLNIPMYLSGNGIGTTNKEIRDIYVSRSIYAMSQAIADGYDVRGYWPWSLMDNYEWGTFDKEYGLYAVDRKGSLDRTLRTDHPYYKVLQRFSNNRNAAATTTTSSVA